MKELLSRLYGLTLQGAKKSAVGAGSDTWFLTCEQGRFVLKYPADSAINNPALEPQLCETLLQKGLPVCQFLKNHAGEYISQDDTGRIFTVQRFLEGKMYDLNAAPDWLLPAQAEMLARIHNALRDCQSLPTGIGADFFRYMTPQNVLPSFQNSLRIALEAGHADIADELRYRIELLERFPQRQFDLQKLTTCATHGDYFISQLLCGEDRINAVIDWTCACVHPVVWELTRSYVYASPRCKEGGIDIGEFCDTVAAYRVLAPLNAEDIRCLGTLFQTQIAVCDYYGQYYASTAANRLIYLHQARFSTALLRWFDAHLDTLNAELTQRFL